MCRSLFQSTARPMTAAWCVGFGLVLVLGLGQPCGAADTVQDLLTIQGQLDPTLRLDKTGTLPYRWDVQGKQAEFVIQRIDSPDVTTPFRIKANAFADALVVSPNRVGINTGTPATTLHVNSFSFDPIPTAALRLESQHFDASVRQAWDLNSSTVGFTLKDVGDATIPDPVLIPFTVESGTPTNTLYLDSTGRVGMGTAAPDANSRLDIRSSLTNGVLMKRPDAGAHYLRIENSGSVFRCGVQGNGDTQFGAITAGKGLVLVAGGTGKVAINSSGQINFGNVPPAFTTDALKHQTGARLTAAGVWTDASSRSVKQDIEPITSEQARDTVRALQPVGYRYKNELDERYVGFIAEDVPELVATSDRKSLAPMDIVAVLTRVVQDQDRLLQDQGQQLTDARRMIASFSERLQTLEKKLDDHNTTAGKVAK